MRKSMEQSPNVFYSERLENLLEAQAGIKLPDGSTYWTPARPLGLIGLNLFYRFRIAYKVFTGQYDALKWKDQ